MRKKQKKRYNAKIISKTRKKTRIKQLNWKLNRRSKNQTEENGRNKKIEETRRTENKEIKNKTEGTRNKQNKQKKTRI